VRAAQYTRRAAVVVWVEDAHRSRVHPSSFGVGPRPPVIEIHARWVAR